MSGLLICLHFSIVWLSAHQFSASVLVTSKKSNCEFIATQTVVDCFRILLYNFLWRLKEVMEVLEWDYITRSDNSRGTAASCVNVSESAF
jgi:hypothetical protein